MTEYALTDADGTVRWRGTIDPPPGGGSIRRLDCGEVTAADLADGSILLYDTQAGELAGPVYLRDEVLTDLGAIEVTRDEQTDGGSLGSWENSPSLAVVTTQKTMDSGGIGAGTNASMLYAAPTTTGPVRAALVSSLGNVPLERWQANHAYADPTGVYQEIIGDDGHIWYADPGGTSGGSEPDFAGNEGGTVADGPTLVWNDSGPIPAVGSCHVYIDVCTPAAP